MSKHLMLLVMMIFSILFIAKYIVAEEDILLVADFETFFNNLEGEMGVYGSLEPDWDDKNAPYSWFYEPKTPGYDTQNVYSGKQSFRLVNALGAQKEELWGSFAINLGPMTDKTVDPIRIKSKDVSKYKYLTFWVKGEKGGEKIEVIFRDSHAPTYIPQAKYEVPTAKTEWENRRIPLKEITGVDLESLDSIGIAFGPDVSNSPGATIYIDDIAFERGILH